MESDNARKYIEDWTFDATSLVDADGVGAIVLRRYEAVKAVEIAEQEAEERVRVELTRWRNPKKELPEEGVPVLAKFHNGTYAVLLRYNHPRLGWGWTFDSVVIIPNDSQIIGWRPIYE